MSTGPAGRHVVRLEFALALAAPDATVRLIRSVLASHPDCDLAATEFAITVGVPVPSATDQALAEVARQVDGAIAGLGLPAHAVSTFSWVRASGDAGRAAGPTGGLRRREHLGWPEPLGWPEHLGWPELLATGAAAIPTPPRWLSSPPVGGPRRQLATVG